MLSFYLLPHFTIKTILNSYAPDTNIKKEKNKDHLPYFKPYDHNKSLQKSIFQKKGKYFYKFQGPLAFFFRKLLKK